MASTPLAAHAPPARLAALLRDLGAHVRRGAPPALAAPRCPTGLAPIDALLGGGVPRGGVTEIAGPATSGRTSLVLALLARATERGELAAVLDTADSFDPPSAAAAGVDLARLLWVRPPDAAASLRGASHLLAAHGFALIVLDLAGLAGRAPGDRLWPRLRRETSATSSALVVVSDRRALHGCADVALDLAPAAARFEPGAEGGFLAALESEVLLVRDRRGGALRSAGTSWPARRAPGAADAA